VIRAILASAALHGFFVTMILLVSVTPPESSGFADTRIHIRMDGNSHAKHASESSTTKSEVSPQNFLVSPQEDIPDAEEVTMSDESVDELASFLGYEPLQSPKPKPDEQVQSIEIIDPLVNLDKQQNPRSSPPNSFLIDWVDGRERRILSFPVIDAAIFPRESKKLLDVMIKIRVSPLGEVLSAELVPPGSGDTRIDRYMHSAAFQLTLEPLLENGGVQEAFLRLLFLEDGL